MRSSQMSGESAPNMSTHTLSDVSAAEHLALYGAFHQGPVNRAIHSLAVPLILFSGLVPCAYVRWPGAASDNQALLNLGLLLVIGASFGFATLERCGALLTSLWLAALWFLATLISLRWPAQLTLLASGVAHAGGWWLTVKLGHQRFEPQVSYAHAPTSSNIYLTRRWYRLDDVGRQVSARDAWLQFAIAPLHLSMMLLFALGYRPQLRSRVAQETALCRARLVEGRRPLTGNGGV